MCELAPTTADVFPDFYGADGQLYAHSDRTALNVFNISGKELPRIYQSMYSI